MSEGLTALGHRVTHNRQSVTTPADCKPFDLVVVWGQKFPTAAQLVASRQVAQRPVIIYDLPLMRWVQRDNGIGLYTERVGRAWDVPAHTGRLDALGVTAPATQVEDNGVILVLGQKPDDASHRMTLMAYADWSARVVRHLNEVAPGHQIWWRPHPTSRSTPAPMGVEVVSCDEPLEEQLKRVGSALTYCSSSQFVCYANGVPCVVWDKGERFGDAVDADGAQQRLAQASWNDWTLDELRTAEPWRVMLEGPPAPALRVVPTQSTKKATKRKARA